MERMYHDYKDGAAIYIVYISEAHAIDSNRPVDYAKELGIRQHTSSRERCDVAERLVKDKKLTIPCLIDGMDNAVSEQYHAWPDRIFLVKPDGTLAVAGGRGPWGFEPALQSADAWLKVYKTTLSDLLTGANSDPASSRPSDTNAHPASEDRAKDVPQPTQDVPASSPVKQR